MFLAVCQGVKKGFSKKNVHFLFLSFYVGERKRDNMKNMESENFIKKLKNRVWGGGWL